MTGGSGFDEAIVSEVKRELGITLRSETMGDGYFDRLGTDVPAMWSLAWVADYPGRNDFLGVLLGTGASNNYGKLELGGVRRRDRRGRLGDRSGGRDGRLRPGRGRSSGTRSRSSRSPTGRAGRCRGRGCWGRARTVSGSCAWRGWHGRTDASPAARPARDRLAGARPRTGRRRGDDDVGRLRRPDRDVVVQDRGRVHAAGHGLEGRRPGRAPADQRRRDRPDGHRGPEPAGGRVVDADLPARPGRRAHPRQHADGRPLAADRRRRSDRRPART